MEWLMQTGGFSNTEEKLNSFDAVKESLLLCEICFETGNFPKGLSKENFEPANFFNIVNPSESKF
jgi:hypothetical protein